MLNHVPGQLAIAATALAVFVALVILLIVGVLPSGSGAEVDSGGLAGNAWLR